MQQDIIQIITLAIFIISLLFALWRIGIWRIKRYKSPILGNIDIYQKYNEEKLLTINSYAQGVSISGKSINQSYWYKIAEETVRFCRDNKSPQTLMLGLGANTISGLIGKLNPSIHQTIVEIDEYIILACKKYFSLDSLPNFNLIQADVYKLVNKKNVFKKPFDVLIIDVFTGKPPYISLKSNQANFIEKTLPWLKKDGMVIFNRPGNTMGARSDSEKLKKYLSTLFLETRIIDIKDPRGYRNNVIIGQFKKLS